MSNLLSELKDGLLHLTLNRPERKNALDGPLMKGLRTALTDAEKRSDVRVVVLSGAGDAFCSGGDIKAKRDHGRRPGSGRQQGSPPSFESRSRALRRNMEAARLLHDMDKPTIAMIGGAAAGAGLNLAGACDLRVASRSSIFFMPFIDVGLSGDYGGTYFWTQILGTAKARELYFLNPRLSANEALNYGLVHRVVVDEELETTTMAMAERILASNEAGYTYAKKALNAAEHGTLPQVLDLEATFTLLAGQATIRAAKPKP